MHFAILAVRRRDDASRVPKRIFALFNSFQFSISIVLLLKNKLFKNKN
jgi:uncharacterized protein YcgL (UPF0745 family)